MEFYSMEQFEIVADVMEEAMEYLMGQEAYEADMEDQFEDEFNEWADNMDEALETGFNPFIGCYDFDC